MRKLTVKIVLFSVVYAAVLGFILTPHARATETAEENIGDAGTAIAANVLCGPLFTSEEIKMSEMVYSNMTGITNMALVKQIAVNVATATINLHYKNGTIKPFCKVMTDFSAKLHGTAT